MNTYKYTGVTNSTDQDVGLVLNQTMVVLENKEIQFPFESLCYFNPIQYSTGPRHSSSSISND